MLRDSLLLFLSHLTWQGETGHITARTKGLAFIGMAGSELVLVAFDLIPKKVQFNDLLIKSEKPDLHQVKQVVLDLNTTRIRDSDQQRRERRERNAEQA